MWTATTADVANDTVTDVPHLGPHTFRHVLWQKTFPAWKEYILKKRTKNGKLALAENMNCHIHVEHMSMRLKHAEAVEHHSVEVKQKVMVTWKLFTKKSIRKTEICVTGSAACVWKHALSAAETEKQKTSLALWHWCLTQHRKSVYETYQVVLRCGLHWKNWASTCKQRQLREGKNPRTGRILHGVDESKGEKSGHTSKSATGSAYGGDELKGNNSVSSTPRFPVSLFNTPREVTGGEQAVTTKKEPQLPAPVPTASPGRTSLPGGRGQIRSRPRQPSFLLESLKRVGIFVHSTTGEESTTLVAQQAELPPVESLNLSNFTTNLSGSESERTVTPLVQHHHQAARHCIC